ncbi:MAG: VWA domain-containing protein [Chloroflexi bacterium]|nr:VWA domain-containing protein [Chloroflexota bacterium]
MNASSGHLLPNLLLFGRLLRALGLDVNPGRMMDLAQALAYVDIGRKSDFHNTARTLLVHDKDDLPLFDMAFNLFWRRYQESVFSHQFSVVSEATFPKSASGLDSSEGDETGSIGDGDVRPISDIAGEKAGGTTAVPVYSYREQLRHKDFSQLTPEEVTAVKTLITQIAWNLGQRPARRWQPGRGVQLDLRRSLRHNLRYGGEMLAWSRRQPKQKARPLIILADISGSMEAYSRLLLHFTYALSASLTQTVATFVFATRLTCITRQLRQRSLERALNDVSQEVADWSGGTRIGEALKTFNFVWSRRVLRRGAIVLLISDGWDRGDPDLLRREIGRLQRSCHRLIWLNPLLGSPRYEPLTRGMQAALPHIDDFLPVHNLVSLEELAQHLQQLTAGKRPYHPPPQPAAFIRRQ